MRMTDAIRGHLVALRALLVLTAILGIGYPIGVWLVAQIPGLHGRAEGSLITVDGQPVASALIGQSFTDAAGRPLPQYLQSRPAHPSLLSQVCARSVAIAQTEGLGAAAGARPFCTPGGKGAVLAVFGPRDAHGAVTHPSRVVSVNEPCQTGSAPFMAEYHGVRVQCAQAGEDYAAGRIVPIRGAAPGHPRVPADAVTASGSGLDPDISPAYADLQAERIAKARGISAAEVRAVIGAHQRGRLLGFLGQARVSVVAVNLELDRRRPVAGCCRGG